MNIHEYKEMDLSACAIIEMGDVAFSQEFVYATCLQQCQAPLQTFFHVVASNLAALSKQKYTYY